ncbi:MAG: ferrous iron transport protein A [Leptolyngbyaceae cyanobacterium SM2_5_2]|nr:ferrous iron transport protein A [Leptolyngbyaceae cyanobacterium SM2_5_2]
MEFNSSHAASQASLQAETWTLTFIGGSADLAGLEDKPQDAESEPQDASASSEAALLPLAMATVGDRLWVAIIQGGRRMVRRLGDVGIVQGGEIIVVSRTESGSVIVGLQGCRIGLGAGMAHRVMVSTSQPVPVQSLRQSPSQPVNGGIDMPVTLHLGSLAVGESGHILGYEKGPNAYREKLLAMGLTPGTPFTVTRQAPMGDPIEIEVRGFKLSLRKSEAAVLRVEKTPLS